MSLLGAAEDRLVQCDRCKRMVAEIDTQPHRGSTYCLDEGECITEATPELTSPVFRELIERLIKLNYAPGNDACQARATLACDIAREFADYEQVLQNCTRAYSYLTRDNISKPLTKLEEVIRLHEDLATQERRDEFKEELEGWLDEWAPHLAKFLVNVLAGEALGAKSVDFYVRNRGRILQRLANVLTEIGPLEIRYPGEEQAGQAETERRMQESLQAAVQDPAWLARLGAAADVLKQELVAAGADLDHQVFLQTLGRACRGRSEMLFLLADQERRRKEKEDGSEPAQS